MASQSVQSLASVQPVAQAEQCPLPAGPLHVVGEHVPWLMLQVFAKLHVGPLKPCKHVEQWPVPVVPLHVGERHVPCPKLQVTNSEQLAPQCVASQLLQSISPQPGVQPNPPIISVGAVNCIAPYIVDPITPTLLYHAPTIYLSVPAGIGRSGNFVQPSVGEKDSDLFPENEYPPVGA